MKEGGREEEGGRGGEGRGERKERRKEETHPQDMA